MHPIHAVWAVPRSMSTAFERMCIERGDLDVFHEPFSVPYYFGPDARNDRFAADADVTPRSYDEVWALLLDAAERRPVLFKDMAYHVLPWVGPELLTRCRHTFLIRHPRLTFASLGSRQPDFTADEAGFVALERLHRAVVATTPPPVIDSGDLGDEPHGVVAAWCVAVGLDVVPASLTWEPGPLPEWSLWEPWHDVVATTSGLLRDVDPATVPPPADPRIEPVFRRSLAIYERFRRERLRPV